MVSRRRFLGYSIAGMFTIASVCRPPDSQQVSSPPASSSLKSQFLDSKMGLAGKRNYLLGYPVNMNTPPEGFFSWRRQLRRTGIGDFSYNNVGNPFAESPIPFHTHDFERELILRFAKNYGFPANDTWGFLSHSGTDSNMHGMYMGRTVLKARTGVEPKCYFTKEAHYSIQILRDLLGMESIYVDALPDAWMDPADLKSKISENKNHPALVVATIGTTFKGGIDHIDEIGKALEGHEHYIHLDAALFGGYLPYTDGKNLVQFTDSSIAERRYDSIAVSCHKFFGFPSPAGLFITTQSNFDEFNKEYSNIHDPEYIGHVPGTITCSRDAVKPAEFWYFSNAGDMRRQTKDARFIMENTTFLMNELLSHFPHLNPVRSNSLSNTVYFKKPSDELVRKYSLATMHLTSNSKRDEYAHVMVMPHASKKVITEFLDDMDKHMRN